MRPDEVADLIRLRAEGYAWGYCVRVIGYSEKVLRREYAEAGGDVKPLGGEFSANINARITPEQHNKYHQLGSSEWLRAVIDQAEIRDGQ